MSDATTREPEIPRELWGLWSDEHGLNGDLSDTAVLAYPAREHAEADNRGESGRDYGRPVLIGVSPARLAASEAEVFRLNAEIGRIMAANMARLTEARCEMEKVAARAEAAERGLYALFALVCGKDDAGRLTVLMPGESGGRQMTFDGAVVDAMAALIEAGEKLIEGEVTT